MFLMRETNSNIVKRMVENVEGGLNVEDSLGAKQLELVDSSGTKFILNGDNLVVI